jgi:hypothetical protein
MAPVNLRARWIYTTIIAEVKRIERRGFAQKQNRRYYWALFVALNV